MRNLRFQFTVLRTALLTLLLISFPVAAELDIRAWDALLSDAVTDGEVSYTRWHENADFDALLNQIGAANTAAMNRQQKLVFYINAYNILAAKGILDGSSPASLLGRYVYFKRDKYLVAGEEITLHALEHELIRPLKEPRIHFAIVCASHSCPVLQSEAYTLSKLDEQLEAAAVQFINDPQRNQFDSARRQAAISSIFKWFEEDFVEAAGSLQAYLAPYIEEEKSADLLQQGAFDVSYQKYDWRLNGTRQAATQTSK